MGGDIGSKMSDYGDQAADKSDKLREHGLLPNRAGQEAFRIKKLEERARIAEQREAELVEVLKANVGLIEKAQEYLTMFLEPGERRIQTDADLTNAMLGLFDGPRQRRAKALKDKALTKQEQENQDEE